MIENFGGDAATTELIRRMKLRAERAAAESTIESSDAEYDAPPAEWWDTRGGDR